MTKKPELFAARAIESEIGIGFDNDTCSPGPWGRADGSCDIGCGWLAVLEVEASQKHPCTNVLKYWPYLEEHNEIKVLLIQVFYEGSPGRRSNRGRLGSWLAERMRRDLAGRFEYCRIVLSRDGLLLEGRDALKSAFELASATD